MEYVDQVKRAELELHLNYDLSRPFAKMVCVAECDQLTNSQ